MKPKKIGITGRKENPLARETAKLAAETLEKAKVKIELDRALFGRGKKLSGFSSDIIISFGGDGTLIAGFRELGRKKTPIMGIHCGNLGFLQAYNHNELWVALKNILNGKYRVEKRARIGAKVDGKKAGEALNEALIVPEKAGRIIRYVLKTGREERKEAGDGLIVATPTGSTAHALSAGGPIVKGNAKVLVVVSVNPVDWSHRPLIINDHEKVVVKEFGNAKPELVLDGQKRFKVRKSVELSKGSEVLLALR